MQISSDEIYSKILKFEYYEPISQSTSYATCGKQRLPNTLSNNLPDFIQEPTNFLPFQHNIFDFLTTVDFITTTLWWSRTVYPDSRARIHAESTRPSL